MAFLMAVSNIFICVTGFRFGLYIIKYVVLRPKFISKLYLCSCHKQYGRTVELCKKNIWKRSATKLSCNLGQLTCLSLLNLIWKVCCVVFCWAVWKLKHPRIQLGFQHQPLECKRSQIPNSVFTTLIFNRCLSSLLFWLCSLWTQQCSQHLSWKFKLLTSP